MMTSHIARGCFRQSFASPFFGRGSLRALSCVNIKAGAPGNY